MRSLLNPNKTEYGRVVNAVTDLQLDGLVRLVFNDTSRQQKIIDLFNDICLDKETIEYRQAILKDLMYNRNIYNTLVKECVFMEKCYAEYDANKAHRSKARVKSEISITDITMSLRDYAYTFRKLLEIYGRLDGMFMANAPTSLGLKQLARSIHKRNNSEGFLKLREKVEKIIESAAAYGYYVSINDYLMPEEMKYIIVTGKYEGEKFSLFKKKEYKGNKVELNERVNEDSRRIVVDSFNRSIVILEDLFETLFDEIGYIVKDFLLYDFGIKLYDIFGERNIDCVFPEIKDHIDYKKVKDPFLITRYIVEGYTHPVYGNNIQIDKDQSVLVLGTNNTGKTVMLRTIGICQIFAQTGLFVPADYACVDIRKDIISIFSGEEKDTNVGGRFEKEVIDIKDIIDEVDNNSLVIINEIFQSTFAEDGEKALFDILNYFSEIDVKWITVTHLLGIEGKRKDFVSKVKTFKTTSKEEKYRIDSVE